MQLYVLFLSVLALFATSHGNNLRATSNGDRRVESRGGLFHRESASISVGSLSICPNASVKLHMNLEARRPIPDSLVMKVIIECDDGASHAQTVHMNDEEVIATFSPPAGGSCEVELLAWYQLIGYHDEESTIHRAKMIASSSFQVLASDDAACPEAADAATAIDTTDTTFRQR